MDDYITRPDDLEQSASTVILVKAMGDTLERHYPGWLWAIIPDERGGVVAILSLRLSGEWGYRLKLTDVQGDPRVGMDKVMRAGGEILERFGVPRGTYRYDRWAAAPKDFVNMARADVSDKSRGVQRHQRDAALSSALRMGQAKLITADDGVSRHYGLEVVNGDV